MASSDRYFEQEIAPHLDGIGNRGLERLLEDVLDPNRNVDQLFRATQSARVSLGQRLLRGMGSMEVFRLLQSLRISRGGLGDRCQFISDIP